MSNQRASDISKDQVLRLAELAKLNLSDEEIETCRQELRRILDFINQLNAVDVAHLPPTEQVNGLRNVLREDKPMPFLNLKETDFKKNADFKDNYFRVP